MATRRVGRGHLLAVVVAAAAALIALSASMAAADGPVGSVAALSGSCYLRTQGSAAWSLASPGAGLEAGDRVRTGPDGRLSVALADGSTLFIGNSTEIEMTRFLLKKKKRSAIFSISTGKVRAVINEFSGTTDMKVRTPTSTSGVKGTDFIVLTNGGANVYFGNEGSVEVRGEGARTAMLGGSEMTESTKGSSPIEPVAVEPGTALDEVRKGLEAATDANAPIEWEKAGQLPEILARWNINYARYLADAGRGAEALDVLSIARDLAQSAPLAAEARVDRAGLLSRELGDHKAALKEYLEIVELYPGAPAREAALFSAGMVSMELGRNAQAVRLFRRYLEQYPDGSHKGSASFLIEKLERK